MLARYVADTRRHTRYCHDTRYAMLALCAIHVDATRLRDMLRLFDADDASRVSRADAPRQFCCC